MRMHPRERKNNPLRRGTDRAQWWAARLLLVVAVGALPAALAVGLAVHQDQARVARAEAADRHPVTARLTTDVPVALGLTTTRADVTWTENGADRRANAVVTSGQPAGTPVRIWLDNRGEVVPQPAGAGEPIAVALTAALLTVTALPLLCTLAWKGTLHVLNRRRYAEWDAEWQQFEPQWTRRQPS
ncbi:Rv1733c family protein [Kitasatospora sp. NPDC004531]